MTSEPLPRSTPSAEGVSAAGLEAFLDAVETDPGIELHSLMVLRHGRVVAEGWWSPHRPDDRRQSYSVSKTFTATALAFALAEDRLALTDRVSDHVGDDASAAGPRSRAITVGHLARMATGHHADTLASMVQRDPAEPVRGFFGLEPEAEPGSVFAYNNGATYTLAAVLQTVTGQSLTDFLQPRLFDPLGIAPPYWDRMGGSRQVGFIGLHLATEDLARLALLYSQDGQWEGRPVLPPGWVDAASQALTPTPDEQNHDWRQGYGYQLWRSRHGYRADGAFGQLALVLPQVDAVVVLTAETEQAQTLLNAVWTHLLPALTKPGTPADDGRLAGRLATLALSVASAATQPADDWVRATSVESDGDDWALTLAAADDTIPVSCGDGTWRRSDLRLGVDRRLVVEARGAWTGETFVADLVLVQSPHRLTVRYAPHTDTSAAFWRTIPLTDPPLANLAVLYPAGSPR